MTENVANNICTLPVTCIGYFDGQNQLEYIMSKVQDAFPNIEWVSMYHLNDTDDTKEHWHILIRNHNINGKININKLRSFFEKEYNGEIKSFLFNAEFRQCKSMYSWYKYVLHDVNYLMSKGLTRNIQYQVSDFRFNSQEFFNSISNYKEIEERNDFDIIVELINNGLSNFDILKELCTSAKDIYIVNKGIDIIRKYM